MIKLSLGFAMPAFALLVGLNCAAVAQDKLRIAGGLTGTWENSFSELGQNAGFFKKHGLVLEIFYTQGAGETQQAVISGSADIGTGVGTFNTFGAFAKGAPIRVIAATHTGANDLTWYVKADSPIKDKKDLAGKSVAYSTTGSSTYAAVQAFQKVFGVTYKSVATGSPASTLTQVMSGQIDVGWTSPPFAVDLLRDGKIRQIMRASDVPELRNQTDALYDGECPRHRVAQGRLRALSASLPRGGRLDVCGQGCGEGICGLGPRSGSDRRIGARRLLPEK